MLTCKMKPPQYWAVVSCFSSLLFLFISSFLSESFVWCCEQSLFTIVWQWLQFPDCSSNKHSPLCNHCLWARHPLYLQLLWLAAVEDGVSAQSLPGAEWVLVCVWPSLTLRLLPEAITVNKNVFLVKLLGGIISLFYLHCFCAHTLHKKNNPFCPFLLLCYLGYICHFYANWWMSLHCGFDI